VWAIWIGVSCGHGPARAGLALSKAEADAIAGPAVPNVALMIFYR